MEQIICIFAPKKTQHLSTLCFPLSLQLRRERQTEVDRRASREIFANSKISATWLYSSGNAKSGSILERRNECAAHFRMRQTLSRKDVTSPPRCKRKALTFVRSSNMRKSGSFSRRQQINCTCNAN